jgi:hypothetical protein
MAPSFDRAQSRQNLDARQMHFNISKVESMRRMGFLKGKFA